ncbi:MAG: glycogen/starch/alpha-glucan phosphorylase [Ignisphaera sp.]|nr:glycogen/starch/alpha-glucan phosphorylase [Ignisphaera sp.]MDW8084811.1 glycogen/starch/alpha-glucan phosphorylase [Ignisphaera sp.]
MVGVFIDIAMEAAFEGSANYAGGLGVLIADKFYTAGRIGLPYILVVPLYRKGYVDWESINGAKYTEVAHRHSLSFLSKLRCIGSLDVRSSNGRLIAEAELYEYTYGSAKAILYRVKRPVVAARMFRYLYRHHNDECTYYMVAAAVSSEIVRRIASSAEVSAVDIQEAHLALTPYLLPKSIKVRFVTHTPGPWGHPKLCKEAGEVLGISLPDVKTMTEAAMEVCEKVFTVSRKHFEVTRMVFPRYVNKLTYVTNAIDVKRWQRIESDPGDAASFSKLHQNLKNELTTIIRTLSGKDAGDRMIISWCRRITRYKRPYFVEWLLEEDMDLDSVFIVTSGKPHPSDEWGRRQAQLFAKFSRVIPNFYFHPSYGTDFAYYTLSGSDLLLFTPFSCWEASGTSMMKAGVNGVPTLSSRDGASLELIEDGVNGWLFGEELNEFIDIERDTRASEIDGKDYRDFVKKLLNIVNLYNSDREKFMEIAYSAYKTFTQRTSMERLLEQYYHEFMEGKE